MTVLDIILLLTNYSSNTININVTNSDTFTIVIGTILGGIITGITGLFIEKYKEREKIRAKHLEIIKNEILVPINDELNKQKNEFDFADGVHRNYRYLESNRDWMLPLYKNYNIEDKAFIKTTNEQGSIGGLRVINKLIYHDLENHYPSLLSKLKDTDVLISQYPKYIEGVIKLIAKVKKDKNYIEISEMRAMKSQPDIEDSILHTMLMIIIGKDS